MKANELADLIEFDAPIVGINKEAAAMLRKQADQLAKYKQALESIANEYVELSHDKIKWQNEDHIKWARDALK